MPAAKANAVDADPRLGKLEITSVAPTQLPIGAGELDAVIFAKGLFEKNGLNQIVPKKDLMAAVMNNDGEAIDTLILVDPINTDNIFDDYVAVKITVPVHATIRPEQCRNVVLKKRNEALDSSGECDPQSSENCDVAGDLFELI